MKIDDKSRAAMQDPAVQTISIEMTPERKEKYQRLAYELIDLLQAKTRGPAEAYMVLKFVMDSFEQNYGIRGGFAIGKDDQPH